MRLILYGCPGLDLIALIIQYFQCRTIQFHTGGDIGLRKVHLCRRVLFVSRQLYYRDILSLVRGIIRDDLIRAVISVRCFCLLHIVFSKRNIQGKYRISVRSALRLLKERVLLHQFLFSQHDVLTRIESEHRTGHRHFCFLVQFPGGDGHLLPLVGKGQFFADHRRILVHITKGNTLRLSVQCVSVRSILLTHLIAAKRDVLQHGHTVIPGGNGIDKLPFAVDDQAIAVCVFLMIRCEDVFCRTDFKRSPLQLLYLPGEFLSVVAGQHFAFLINGQFSLYRMILQCHFDHHIAAHLFNQMRGVLIHGYRNTLRIDSISFGCIHLLNPILTKRKRVRQDQVSVLIREIGSMLHRERICCHLLHIAVIGNIKYLKLRIRKEDRPLCLVILFDDLQFGLELLIQQHSPDLRCIRKVLRHRHSEIIYRIEVMRRCCLLHNILSIRNRDGLRISLLIREQFTTSVRIHNDRRGSLIIVAAIRILSQGTDQIDREACALQERRIGCLSVIACFDDLERLLLHGLGRLRRTFHNRHHVAFIVTGDIMSIRIDQISDRRRDLLDVIAAKVQIRQGCIPGFIDAEGSYLGTSSVHCPGLPVRMIDRCFCVQSVNGSLKSSISLRSTSGLLIFLNQMDRCLYSFIRYFLVCCHACQR